MGLNEPTSILPKILWIYIGRNTYKVKPKMDFCLLKVVSVPLEDDNHDPVVANSRSKKHAVAAIEESTMTGNRVA